MAVGERGENSRPICESSSKTMAADGRGIDPVNPPPVTDLSVSRLPPTHTLTHTHTRARAHDGAQNTAHDRFTNAIEDTIVRLASGTSLHTDPHKEYRHTSVKAAAPNHNSSKKVVQYDCVACTTLASGNDIAYLSATTHHPPTASTPLSGVSGRSNTSASGQEW
jgi:hypothetical protein